MLEQHIQTAILRYLKTRPDCWCVKVMVGSVNGTPDILAVIGGRFVAIEVKAPAGKVSPIQQAQIDRINAAGGLAFVARSVDDVKAALASTTKNVIQ